jgi:putative nucleotidyltransferase with HDIG domain
VTPDRLEAAGGPSGSSAHRDRADGDLARAVPAQVHDLLAALWAAGHAAYAVGGAIRDVVAGRPAADWDLATSALPEQTAALFDDAAYENLFGTVAVRRGGATYEITTFRSDHDYADFRRPHRVEFGTSLEADLARRDFTMNALAWGSDGPAPAVARLVDPFSGVADIRAGLIRAVGDPRRRFEEDALRTLRAIRFAATLGWAIEPATLAAIHEAAPLVRHLSGERIATELEKLLGAERPSVGLRLLAEAGALSAISAELARQPGVAQNKIAGEDLWDHTLRTVDESANRTIVRLAALLHDIGKPATAADGHFYGHEVKGAELADELLDRLHTPVATRQRVVHLVRHHMFRYEPSWGDPAVRRFLGKIGPSAIDDLFALREADNAGSGVPRDADGLGELRARVAAELERGAILDRSALRIDGAEVMNALGIPAGPEVGRVLAALFERVVQNPRMNEPAQLLDTARRLARPADPGELSVQLYTVRETLATDPDATLGRLAELGFRSVEPFDLLTFREPLREGLVRHDLVAPTAHVDLLGAADLDQVFAAALELGIGTLVQPWTEPSRWNTVEGVAEIARQLASIARRAADRGLSVAYHNHHFELAAQLDGPTALELFADRVGSDVVLEVDAYWAFAGGADVPALLGRLGERVVALHVKDGDGSLDVKRQVAAGRGALPIPAILAAAPRAVRVLELDDTEGDRFAALRDGRAFVLGLGPGPDVRDDGR